MASKEINDTPQAASPPLGSPLGDLNEKRPLDPHLADDISDTTQDEGHVLNVTEDDLLEAKALASSFTLEDTRRLMKQVHIQHARDPNFPISIIDRIEQFIGNDDVFENPEKHERLIQEMKIEAALITSNSPYAEVRAVVDNRDDPAMPTSTIRAWVIGIFFACCISFINSFFDVRLPSIYVIQTVPQLLAYPVGRFFEREHMLITIMSNVAKSTPYTNYIVWIQVLPQYFNQPWAISVGYQTLIALSTNFIGYGLAGICRRFLVYPAYCVWPSSLVTIALNSAFHDTDRESAQVLGPLKSIWKMSRIKFFLWGFTLMFFYFWLPNYLFAALSYFSLNPIPSFDWNIITYVIDPLMVPFYSTFNVFLGAFFSMFIIIAIYYTNTWNTAYLPINSNRTFDHFGKRYKVASIIDESGIFDGAKYEAYSPPFLSAGNAVVYMFFFAVYSSTVTYGILYHRHEIMLGLRDAWTAIKTKRSKRRDNQEQSQEQADRNALDVHNRLMASYKEVPEWWYMICLAIALGLGIAGIAAYPTSTTPLQDLKLAHYIKIAPRFTFWAQMVPTLVSTFISIAVLQYQVHIKDICTEDAPFRFTCPGVNTFFTAAVFWGTVGPRKIWGVGGQYAVTLIGFPAGVLVVAIFYVLSLKWPKNAIIRNAHPVVMFNGALSWSPYTLAYIWPAVPVAAFSWLFLKKRYLDFWSKYNFVTSAAFSCAVAISGIVIFFALQIWGKEVHWWGNDGAFEGCEGSCTLLELTDPEEYFGPRLGDFH
ncbi:unnamed protein product [Parascedosporium putredinis]|uniref:Uncharacterized protein n=1 Tax=Parascedosporium putredinis TaxID=1442378 RepID=A0A9P1H8M8_9PEZI|nr:unnamed protein product [Parascedosporium putredinis]CAI8001042.1 unnamed protein product [Parascedosporium putredinis]